jgi:8-oxo-dGTP pyrophosphatase MutT (NUDIX family)
LRDRFILSEILVEGRFLKENIIIYYKPKRIAQDPAAKQLIESEWSVFPYANPDSFNGPLFRLDSYGLVGSLKDIDKIELYLSDTDYKEFVGTRNQDFATTFPKEKMSNPVSVGVILISKDNKLILGRRSSSIDSDKSSISVVAGYLDPRKDLIRVPHSNSQRVDIFYGICREIHEETGIEKKDIVELTCIGLIDNKLHNQINIPFYARLNLLAQDVLNRAKYCSKKEFAELSVMQNNEQSIKEFMEKSGQQFSDILYPILNMHRHVNLKQN